MARLGAEYTDSREGVASAAVPYARRIFYARIEELAPEVLEALRDDVLPLYPGDESDALRAWSEKFGLSDDWALADARSTLWTWRQFPQNLSYQRLCFHGEGYGGALDEGPPRPAFELPTAELTVETWDGYTTRACQAFERALRDYRKAWEEYAAEHGLQRAPEKRARSGGDPTLHFNMLVRFQVQGWTHKDIGREYRTSRGHPRAPKSVASAVRSTAELIGLTRRSTPQ